MTGITEQPTIFVVDDDAALRRALSLSLRERGFHVEAYASAEEFLGAKDVDRHGCLLLDVRLPELTGLDVQDALLAKGIKIPIIFISAHGDIPTSVRAIRKGAIDFLEKPYSLDIMLNRIAEALEEDRRFRETDAESRAIRARCDRLTDRELEVMTLIVAGAATATNREVAEKLGISHRTVETYRARLMEKMNARSLPELVQMARVCGLYRPSG
jgi:FixJ family two-component response regulator